MLLKIVMLSVLMVSCMQSIVTNVRYEVSKTGLQQCIFSFAWVAVIQHQVGLL